MTREAHRITKLLNLPCASSIYVAALTQCNGSFDRHSHKLSATDPSEPKHNICIERRRRHQRRKTIMFLPQVIFATAVIITGKPVCVSLLFALLDLMRRWDVCDVHCCYFAFGCCTNAYLFILMLYIFTFNSFLLGNNIWSQQRLDHRDRGWGKWHPQSPPAASCCRQQGKRVKFQYS